MALKETEKEKGNYMVFVRGDEKKNEIYFLGPRKNKKINEGTQDSTARERTEG